MEEPRQRPVLVREYYIDMDVNEIAREVVERTQVAQERYQWQALVNM
jgi:hypothetical protein